MAARPQQPLVDVTNRATAVRERAELLQVLLRDGILRRTESQPVLSRDGSSHRWMLDSLAVTMTPRGAELAGRLLLRLLESFDGRQVATYGVTGIPILQSIVLQSGGRYNGLIVRKERKEWGSRKLIEGRIDPDEPTILIDDSISSGFNASEGCDRLEEAGLRVEGCVTLVRFGWESGVSLLRERGYHVEALYDIWEDFMANMEDEPNPDHNPTKAFPDFEWSERRATERQHPASLAREVLREYFATGKLLRPPATLDRSCDSAGGTWVSVRSRGDIHDRHARDGFWHFPGEQSWGPPEDIVRAALRTAAELPQGAEGIRLIDSSHIAVTLFSALEECTAGQLDNDRYGIVVCSRERPDVMGGALPRMPGIRDEFQQFRHAHTINAQLLPHEPYILFRHGVTKFVEPRVAWQSSGVPGHDRRLDCGVLAERARKIALGKKRFPQLPKGLLPKDTAAIFVTVFIDGELRGCMGSEVSNLDRDLRSLTKLALQDDRFDPVPLNGKSSLAVTVSVLFNELDMGGFSREEVPLRYLNGRQALKVEQGSREGMLLPFVATMMSLDAEDFVAEVTDKAGVTREPYNWRRFDCVTWLADEQGVALLEGGFPRAEPTLTLPEIARLQADYLLRNQRSDGSLFFGYYPFQNTRYQDIDMPRLAHAAWTLARAGFHKAARKAIKRALAEPVDDVSALSRDAFLLLADCEMPNREEPPNRVATIRESTAQTLWSKIDRHGRIDVGVAPISSESDDEDEPASDPSDEYQNYFPGQVLLALAAAVREGATKNQPGPLDRAFRYYRHRFRHRRDFGQVSWLMQAFAAWWRITRERALADFVFEIGDWILEFQQRKTGGFINDHQPDSPGYTTAVYLEGIAAGARLARELPDQERDRRYSEAHRKGFEFLDRLILQPRDASILPNPGYASGGLRENLYSSHVRIDFVQHSLAAILELYPHVFRASRNTRSLGESDGEKEETR